MRDICLKDAIKLAKNGTGPISKIIQASNEVGIIVPSILLTNLKKEGYKVSYHVGPGETALKGDNETGAWVQIRLNDNVVGRAYSENNQDALLQAIYGMLKEENGINRN